MMASRDLQEFISLLGFGPLLPHQKALLDAHRDGKSLVLSPPSRSDQKRWIEKKARELRAAFKDESQ